jgi:beta-fructofuranosidase
MKKCVEEHMTKLTRRRFVHEACGLPLMALSGGRLLQAADPGVDEEVRRKLASDRHRPQFHFLPPANWMNDPNGPIFWRGEYHVFYQYNPNGAFSGTKHWGHTVTSDLVHWKNLPIALAPSPGGPDKDGVYTGCAVIDGDRVTLVYTGIRPEVQMIATADTPDLMTWTKYSGNPVIAGPPPGMDATGFRDPCVWKEAGAWYMIIGSGFRGVGGAALLYRSPDLRKWEYLHPLYAGIMDKAAGPDVKISGQMWECPDFFPLEGKYALLTYTKGGQVYFIGDYSDHAFHPELEGRADFGCDYAAKTMLDGSGRRIYWGWIDERRTVESYKAAGWAGCLSLPRVLKLAPGNLLGMDPAPELTSLRANSTKFSSLPIPSGESALISGVSGDCLEIVAGLDAGGAEEVGVRVRCAPDGSEQTVIAYNRVEQTLFADTTRASQDPQTTRGVQRGRFVLAPGEPLMLRVFLDASVIEVFANGRACLTTRVYPTQADSLGVGLFANNGRAQLRSMEVWKLKPISSDRMTSV